MDKQQQNQDREVGRGDPVGAFAGDKNVQAVIGNIDRNELKTLAGEHLTCAHFLVALPIYFRVFRGELTPQNAQTELLAGWRAVGLYPGTPNSIIGTGATTGGRAVAGTDVKQGYGGGDSASMR
jgi:hypothetical protein